ncbi:helix-turn-helix domain-containing protein, partial [Vibrio sp. S11_S32]|uniref:helix-turn-helix domain-containing protein n=1 Tax=Vibrio sp. S11_S32 TaxID=2720225 RepID=UPI0016819AD5
MGKQYKQLTLVERYQIEALVQLEFSARQIGKELKRGNKSISSELGRCPQGRYTAITAH